MPILDSPRTDSALLGALSVPVRQADYPRDSKAFVRIDTSLRVYWHSLFDICPGLLRLTEPDGLAIFRPFMAWADEQGLSLNWTYYLWVDIWLRQSPFRDRLDTSLRYDLVAASAARWATSDRSRSLGIVLGAEGLADLVCAWKAHSVDTGRQVERLALVEPLPMSGKDLGYFVLASKAFPDFFPRLARDTALSRVLPADFWRGFFALVLSFVVAQLAAQVDLTMLARAGVGLPGLYMLMTRMALFEFATAMALGTTLSVAVAQAVRQGSGPHVTRQALVLTAVVGSLLGLLAIFAYPWLLPLMLEGDSELAKMSLSALPWFILAIPFRLLNVVTAFILHARGEGALVLRWKLLELGARIILLLILLEGLQSGLWGCFLAGLVLNLCSAVWSVWWLAHRDRSVPWVPSRAWVAEVLRSTSWEGQRVLAMQLFGFSAVALFAVWGATTDRGRLDAFSAGMTLMLLVFAPLNAWLRFLSMRFARLSAQELGACIPALVKRCLPLAIAAAVLLVLGAGWFGSLYGQQGEWWTAYLWLLAASLPLRLIGNLLRAARQSQGDFSLISKIDILGLWLIGMPALIAGLYLGTPWMTYLYLLLPELLAVVMLSRGGLLIN